MNVLSIGGSDPSAGAGIQQDLKTFYALGVYGLTVVTTITSQNSSKFSEANVLSTTAIKSQIRSIFSDFDVAAIKVGMVFTKEIILSIKSELEKRKIPIVLDPVIKSTTGGTLLKKNALRDYKKHLIPLSYAITPNVEEAGILSGVEINHRKDLEEAAHKIQKLGTKNVVITGFVKSKTKISDYILSNNNSSFIENKRISTINHGSGCAFSAALTVFLAERNNFFDSVKFANSYVGHYIQNANSFGRGIKIVEPQKDALKEELRRKIKEFCKLDVARYIPQCQTNFVYSKPKPKGLDDCVGIQGRIVKTGNLVTVAGRLEYGGSKHVATAVLSMNKKFSRIRSAINLKLDQKLIKKFLEKGYIVESYDRKDEPQKVKKEGSSIEWGIKTIIKNMKEPCDVIYHKGDFGKEPMLLVLGENPTSVMKKLANVLNS